MRAFVGPYGVNALGRDARLHLVTLLAVGIAYYGFFAVGFPLYLLRLGYDTRFIGLLGAAGTVAFVALGLPAAAFGRRFGPRAGALLGTTAYLLGFTLLPLADLLPPPLRTAWLSACYLLGFAGGPFYWVCGNLYLAAATTVQERTLAYALRTAALPLAGVIGSLLGGAIAGIALAAGGTNDDPAPYRTVLLLGGLAYLPALLATYASRDLRPAATAQRSVGGTTPWAALTAIGAVEVVRTSGEAGARGWLGVRLDALGVAPGAIGAAIGVGLAASAIAALATPAICRRWGERTSIAVALAGMALGLALLTLPHPLAASAGAATTVAFAALAGAALSAYRLSLIASPSWPLLAGIVVTSQGAGETIAMAAGGVAIATMGFAPLYAASAAMTVLAAWAMARPRRRSGVSEGS
jgi:hypothetical protein